jgi:hypothetical protein
MTKRCGSVELWNHTHRVPLGSAHSVDFSGTCFSMFTLLSMVTVRPKIYIRQKGLGNQRIRLLLFVFFTLQRGGIVCGFGFLLFKLLIEPASS